MRSDGPFRTVPLGSLLKEKPRNGYSPQESPGWEGLHALGLGCLTSEGFQPRQLKNIPDSPMARRFLLKDGDLLVSRANTRELVGLAGRYRDVGHPCIYPDLMMRLPPDPQRCLPEFLEIFLLSDTARKHLRAGARGTSESMVKISAKTVEELPVPLPSLPEQRRIVAEGAAGTVNEVRLRRGWLEVPRPACPTEGGRGIARWYAERGDRWLAARLPPLAGRLGVGTVSVTARDLGERWGACRPDDTIVVHWAVMQLPPQLVDYVLVHELAHLRAPGHGAAFRRQVRLALPDAEARAAWFDGATRDLWKGDVR